MKSTYLIIGIISIIVVGVVIFGFSVAGSPFETRARKIDEERVRDIGSLKNAIQTYYTKNNSLPKTLSELDGSSYYLSKNNKVDPETGEEYEYSITNNTNYKICATFSTASNENKDPYNYYNKEFKHPKEYHCFNLTIPEATINSQRIKNYKITLVSPISGENINSPITFAAKTTGSGDRDVKIVFQKWDGSSWKSLGETNFSSVGSEQSIKVDADKSSFYWRARACDEKGICGSWSNDRLISVNPPPTS